MSEIWETKYGSRRVRHDPPTLEEAIAAAQGLSDELDEQIEIAAGLMALPVDARARRGFESGETRQARARCHGAEPRRRNADRHCRAQTLAPAASDGCLTILSRCAA